MVKKYEKTIKERFPEIAPIVLLKWGNLEEILKVKDRTELQQELEKTERRLVYIPEGHRIITAHLDSLLNIKQSVSDKIKSIIYKCILTQKGENNEKIQYIPIAMFTTAIYSILKQENDGDKFFKVILQKILDILSEKLGMYYAVLKSKNKKIKYGKMSCLILPQHNSVTEVMIYELSLLPMVVEPKPWFDNYSGGYITKTIPLVNVDRELTFFAKNEDKYYEAINKLQEVPFYLNFKKLLKILQHPQITLEHLLNKNSKTDTSDMLDYLNELKNPEWVKYKLSKRAWETGLAHTLNKTETTSSLQLLYNLIIIYENLGVNKYYLPIFTDTRGRMYSKGTLSPINTKFVREIINFDYIPKFLEGLNETEIKENILNYQKQEQMYQKYYTAFQTKKEKSFDEAVLTQEKYQKKISKSDIRNEYCSIASKYLCPTKYSNNTIISPCLEFDATASMLQILAIITRDEKLAKLTNIQNSKEILDPYQYICQIISDTLEKNIIQLNEDEISETLIKKILKKRNMIKGVIMRWVYGARALTLSDYVEDSYPLLKNKHTIIIVNIITKTFLKEFPKLGKLMKFFRTYGSILSALQEPMILDMPYGNLYASKYHKIKRMKTSGITIKDENKCQKIITVSFTGQDINTLNQSKYLQAMLPNLIHALDAYVAMKTRLTLLDQQNIPTLSIHDCFITPSFLVPITIWSYNNALATLLDINILKVISYNENYVEKALMNNKNKMKNFIELKSTIEEMQKEKMQIDLIHESHYSLIPQ